MFENMYHYNLKYLPLSSMSTKFAVVSKHVQITFLESSSESSINWGRIFDFVNSNLRINKIK